MYVTCLYKRISDIGERKDYRYLRACHLSPHLTASYAMPSLTSARINPAGALA